MDIENDIAALSERLSTPEGLSINFTPLPANACGLDAWYSVATHTHHLRSMSCDFATAKLNLLTWCRRHGVRAIGLGSPWGPEQAAAYRRCEGPDRDRYYAGEIPHESVKHQDELQACFDQLNELAGDDILVYLDNETPKSRYGHLWWFGWHYDVPAWHDYSQDRPISYYSNDPQCEINPLTGEPHRRRPYLEIVATQRAAGARGVWAHSTSWWWGREQAFTTNIAAELPLHLLVDGYLDGMVVMGYDACHRHYQNLWFHLLDKGYRIPGYAESDYTFDHPSVFEHGEALLSWFPQNGKLDRDAVVRGSTKRVFMSTGGRINVEVDGAGMNEACQTHIGKTHELTIAIAPPSGQSQFSRLDIIRRGGEVVASIADAKGGVYRLSIPGAGNWDYVIVRAFGETDDPEGPQQGIHHLVLSNPVYLRPVGLAEPAPMTTTLTLSVQADSPWTAAALESAAGEHLATLTLKDQLVMEDVPASSRLRLTAANGREEIRYLAMENEDVQALLRYLHNGEFLQDFPECQPGHVPPEAFRFEDLRQALRECHLRI